LPHLDGKRIIAMRSYDSKARAYARIWALPRIWQRALIVEAHYIIEVLAQHYDRLTVEEKEKTLIHELLHIPSTFSGNLVPHECFGKTRVGKAQVEKLYARYKANTAQHESDDGLMEMS